MNHGAARVPTLQPGSVRTGLRAGSLPATAGPRDRAGADEKGPPRRPCGRTAVRPGPSPSVPTPGRWRSGATPGGLGWRRTPRPHAGARELAVPRRSLGGTGAERRALAATHPHQPREAERGSRAGAGTRRGGLPLSAGGRPLRPLVPPPPAGPASRPPVHRAPRPGRLLGAGPEDGAPGAPTGLADRSIFRGGAVQGALWEVGHLLRPRGDTWQCFSRGTAFRILRAA